MDQQERREDGVTGWGTVGRQSGSHTWRMLDLAEKATTKKSTRRVRSKVSGQQDNNARVLAKDKGNKPDQTRLHGSRWQAKGSAVHPGGYIKVTEEVYFPELNPVVGWKGRDWLESYSNSHRRVQDFEHVLWSQTLGPLLNLYAPVFSPVKWGWEWLTEWPYRVRNAAQMPSVTLE